MRKNCGSYRLGLAPVYKDKSGVLVGMLNVDQYPVSRISFNDRTGWPYSDVQQFADSARGIANFDGSRIQPLTPDPSPKDETDDQKFARCLSKYPHTLAEKVNEQAAMVEVQVKEADPVPSPDSAPASTE